VSWNAGWSRLKWVPQGFLSVACQPALPVKADHWVWPHPPPPEPSALSLVAADALGVEGQVRDELFEGAAVLGVPGEVLQLRLIYAGSFERCPVVEDGDGVPVFRRAVPVPVPALPQLGQAGLVVGVVDVLGGPELVQRPQHVQVGELGELGQVVGEHVRRGVGDEAGGELGPVGIPAVLRDVDAQPGVGLLERVGALLVAGLLGRVPQPVLDGAEAAAGTATAGGQRADGDQRQGGRQGPFHR
jgi:hypothetical protein